MCETSASDKTEDTLLLLLAMLCFAFKATQAAGDDCSGVLLLTGAAVRKERSASIAVDSICDRRAFLALEARYVASGSIKAGLVSASRRPILMIYWCGGGDGGGGRGGGSDVSNG